MSNVINAFPGYEFKRLDDGKFHNMYRGTDVGKGGYVYAEPGMYGNVALLDVQSMHPTSIMTLNAFGEYTQNYKDIYDARILIKHHKYDEAKHLLGGVLEPYLTDEKQADDLSKALKLCLNGTYGLTSATFSNPFRHPMNDNNIVALKGALFMRTLQDEVQQLGYKVVHIKTDSIKVPNADKNIINFIMDFGKKYGYTFEHEATYDKMCLVNNAVYIAKYSDDVSINGKHAGQWTATGAQFQVPYVFKHLFSKEPITFEDLCETKSVKEGAIFLDMNENLPDSGFYEDLLDLRLKNSAGKKLAKAKLKLLEEYSGMSDEELKSKIDAGHDLHFIGRVGQFTPIKPGCGGGILYRVNEGRNFAVTGTDGYRWMESEVVKELGKEDDIDKSYYHRLVDEARSAITKYGNFDWFVSDKPYDKSDFIYTIPSDELPF